MAGLQHDSRVERRMIFGWAIAIITAIFIAWIFGNFIAHRRPAGNLALPSTAPGETPSLGVLDQNQFDSEGRGQAEQEAERQQLTHYGWNDPDHRTAHIPIERAKALLLQQQGGGRGE